jgi:tetratricopeptide (TPR) repeat protein
MLFMIEPNENSVATPYKKPDIEVMKEKALQCQNLEIIATQLSEELLRGSSVNNIEEKIKERYSYISSALRYVLANKCLDIGRTEDGLRLAQQPYQKAQSADFNYCQGGLEFTTGIGYRLLGDFKTAKEHLTKALESYPGIENYNYVKEMYVDGIISESGFGGFPWFSCKKLAQTLN